MRYGGAVWRFCNIGNRAAFAARPDVYMPQFGGYDPVGVARGVAVAGNPNLWLIAGERLFLFYDRARLEKFAADPSASTRRPSANGRTVLHGTLSALIAPSAGAGPPRRETPESAIPALP